MFVSYLAVASRCRGLILRLYLNVYKHVLPANTQPSSYSRHRFFSFHPLPADIFLLAGFSFLSPRDVFFFPQQVWMFPPHSLPQLFTPDPSHTSRSHQDEILNWESSLRHSAAWPSVPCPAQMKDKNVTCFFFFLNPPTCNQSVTLVHI